MRVATLRMPDEASAGEAAAGPSREVLLSRVLDQVATTTDWDALERMAARDATVWRELAQTVRQNQDLAHAVACAANQADMIDFESIERAELQRGVRHERRTSREHNRSARQPRYEHVAFKRRLRTVATWSGWLAAAALAVAFINPDIARRGTSPSLPGVENQATLIPQILSRDSGATSAEALRDYLRKGNKDGTVIGEMPRKILMEAQPAADGNGYEVVYIRQILERARVNDIYRFSQDETGRATPVPVQIRSGSM